MCILRSPAKGLTLGLPESQGDLPVRLDLELPVRLARCCCWRRGAAAGGLRGGHVRGDAAPAGGTHGRLCAATARLM